jgi:hypothetical protein
MPTAIKLTDDFVELARGEGRVMGRSIAGQVEHWARLGRALERAPGFDYERIRAVLSAQASFDALGADEQTVALAALEAELEQPLPAEREKAFFARLRARGVPIYGEPRVVAARGARVKPRRRSRRRAAAARGG